MATLLFSLILFVEVSILTVFLVGGAYLAIKEARNPAPKPAPDLTEARRRAEAARYYARCE